MKKLIQFLLVMIFTLSCFAIFANAALTENQKNTLVEFTEDFLREGVEDRHIVWYGGGGDFAPPSYQMKLVHIESLYYTVAGKRKKLVFMLNPDGYATFADYYFESQNSTGGYLKKGDYLILDCTAFVSLMYKGALGMRFDYCISGHMSSWTTSHYLYDDYADFRRVIDKNGNEIDLFQTIYDDDRDKTKFSLASALTSEVQSTMEVGDIIVGNNANTGLGHILFYAGDGYVYHSSSEPYYLPNGRIAGNLQRKEAISALTNESYTILKVLRINDGVLDEDFKGFTMDYDFDALNTEKSIFDTLNPYIKNITATPIEGTNRFTLTVTASDEFSGGRTVSLASDPGCLIKGSGQGESGILGYYANTTGKIPRNMTWNDAKTNIFTTDRTPGTYYMWVHDAAENISDRYTIVLSADGQVKFYTDSPSYDYPEFEKTPSIENFTKKNTYTSGMYRDVADFQWFAPYAKGAYEIGLMLGTYDGTTFEPNKEITVDELITLISRVHNIYNGGSGVFEQVDPWYAVYRFYAIRHGLIANGEYTDGSAIANRTDMAYLFAKILPKKEYTAINTVTRLPDVNENTKHADSIFLLYRAGLVAGTDPSGTFEPNKTITRAEIAAIITRLADPSTRQHFSYT